VLLRQATADTPDLVEVTWTANSGVIISAHLRPQGWAMGQNPATLAGKTIPLGYGNNSENRMQFEGIGARFAFLTGQESPVYFSIAAIRNNVVGHALFTVHPLNIRALDGKPTPEQTPDQIAGTWQKVSYHEWLNAIASELGSDGPFYAQLAVYYTLIRIKNIIAQGGNVTLDDWGIFEARWSESKPVKGPAGTWYTQPGERSVAFVPSIGFVAGTKAGIVMTDAEAKALKP
jgi:nucleoid DNA-binding protein